MAKPLVRERIPEAVIERDLNRLMGLGIVRAWSSLRGARRPRMYEITRADGSLMRWEVGKVYAYVTGAMDVLMTNTAHKGVLTP